MNQTELFSTLPYKVADMSLADFGRKEIELAEKEMPGLLSNSNAFNQKLKLLYISVGEQDPRLAYTKAAVSKFRESGLKVEFASFPGDHEWQVWRKSLHDFAQRVFK